MISIFFFKFIFVLSYIYVDINIRHFSYSFVHIYIYMYFFFQSWCEHDHKVRSVVGATYESTASKSLGGCRVTRSLCRVILPVSTCPHDATNMQPSNMASLWGLTTLQTPASATVTGCTVVAWASLDVVSCTISWASLHWHGNGHPRLGQRTQDTHTKQWTGGHHTTLWLLPQFQCPLWLLPQFQWPQ